MSAAAALAPPPVRHPRAWWAAIGVALAFHVVGIPGALALAVALVVVHGVLLRARGHRTAGLPLQVRVAFLGLLAAGTWPPLAFVHLLQCAGVAANVAFDYCLLARALSLAPWNRHGRLTAARAWRALTAPPGPGAAEGRRAAAPGR